jgi:hypothetical protein
MARALNMYVMEPGSLIMERKMLTGIKQRAEQLATTNHGANPPIAASFAASRSSP